MGLGALLPLAVWSRDWTAIGLVVVAIATNPFWFSPPRRRDGFMYHGVRGERLWIRDGLAKTQRTQSAAAGLAALVGLWLCWERVALGPVLYLASVVWKLVYIRRMAGYSRARPSAPFP